MRSHGLHRRENDRHSDQQTELDSHSVFQETSRTKHAPLNMLGEHAPANNDIIILPAV